MDPPLSMESTYRSVNYNTALGRDKIESIVPCVNFFGLDHLKLLRIYVFGGWCYLSCI